MRRLPIDHCPSCGVRAVSNTYCARCEVDMVDANGHGRIEPTVLARKTSFTRAGYARIACFAVVAAVWLGTFGILDMRGTPFAIASFVIVGTVQIVGLFIAIELSQTAPSTSETVALATAALSAPEKVRGRVVTLRAATGSPDRVTAARVVRYERLETMRPVGGMLVVAPFDDMHTLIERTHRDASVGGRFAVVGDAGVAVVDDDALVIVDGRASTADALRSLRDGDEVEVFGPARRALAADAAHLTEDGSGMVLVFDGTPTQKVWVVVRDAPRSEIRAPLGHRVPLAA